MKKILVFLVSAGLVFCFAKICEPSDSELLSVGGGVAIFMLTVLVYTIFSFIVDEVFKKPDSLAAIKENLPNGAVIEQRGSVVLAYWTEKNQLVNCNFDLKTKQANCHSFTTQNTFTGTISEVLEKVQTK